MANIVEIKDVKQLEILQDLAFRIWPDTFKDILSEEQLSYMLDMFYSIDSLKNQINIGHSMFLLFENELPVGFVCIEINYQNKPTTKIHKLYILPEIQGKSFGRTLIEFVEIKASEVNNNALLLNVNKYNHAIGFYKKLGFEIILEQVINIGNGYVMDDFQMLKQI